MRRNIRQELTVNLFPFLAVLICTFGVLIVLLVIVTKAADQQSNQEQQVFETKLENDIELVNAELDMHRLRIEGIQQIRPELLKKLSDEKKRRAHLMAEIDRIHQRLKISESTLEFARERSLNDDDQERLEGQLAELNSELAAEKEKLLSRQSEGLPSKTVYSVVPYSGDSSTDRKPIYIVCEDQKLVLQPFGVEFSPSDFIQPILPNNPLDAALIAVKEYFIKNKLNGEPYPLLIIKEDGASSYALARHAMKSWDEEFGYELVHSSMELQFGDGDPQLESEIRLAVNSAKSRQATYELENIRARSQDRWGENVEQAGLTASRGHGGFVREVGGEIKSQKPKNRMSDRTSTPNGTQKKRLGGAEPDIAVKNLGASNSNRPTGRERKVRSSAGIAKANRDSTGYRRPVRISLNSNGLFLEPERLDRQRYFISTDSGVAIATENLVKKIGHRMERWGVAGVNAHWIPELEIDADESAQQVKAQIESLILERGFQLKADSSDE